MMKLNYHTTIRVRREDHGRLNKLKRKGDNMDDVIRRLLDEHESGTGGEAKA